MENFMKIHSNAGGPRDMVLWDSFVDKLCNNIQLLLHQKIFLSKQNSKTYDMQKHVTSIQVYIIQGVHKVFRQF